MSATRLVYLDASQC